MAEIDRINRNTAIALQEDARELFVRVTSLGWVEPVEVPKEQDPEYPGVFYYNRDANVLAKFLYGGVGFVLVVYQKEDSYSGKLVVTIGDGDAKIFEEAPGGSRITGELALPFADRLVTMARRRFFPVGE